MPLAPPPTDLLPVFNAQPGATLLLSPEWVIVGASDDYLAATLTQRAALVGQYIFDAFPDNPETPEANAVANVRASLEQVLATRQPHEMAPQHYDVPDPAHPGQFVERHWLPRHTPVLDAAGQVQCIIQSVQDITARRRAEQQLRDSQAREQQARAEAEQQRQRFREVLQQLPAYVAVYHGPDHVYQFVNPPYQSLFPHRAFPGRPFRDVMPEANGLGVVALFDRVYQTGEPYHVPELEGWFDFQDTGEPEQVFLNVHLQPLRNAQGHVDGVLDYSHNVTEQVRARQQLQHLHQVAQAAREEAEAERQRLTQMLLRMPATIALLRGPAHVYDFVNAAYERLFPGRRPLGRPLREVIPELEGQGYYELFDRVYETGEPFYEAEAEAWADYAGTGEPQRRYYRTTFEPIRDARGQVTEVLHFAVDVTAQVEARRQVEQLNQQVEAARAEAERGRAQLQALLTQAPVAIALLQGEDLRVVSANDLITELWGYTPADVLGRPLLEGVPELQGQGFDDLMRDVMRTQVPFVGKETSAVMLRHGQLQTSCFDFVYHPQYDAGGQVQGVIIVATDMTEQVRSRQQVEHLNAELETRVQQRTQEALGLQADLLAAAQRLAQERDAQRGELQHLFEQAPVAIAVFRGPQYVIELTNPSMCALWGRTPQQALGVPLFELLPEVAGQGFEQLLDRVRTTGEPFVAHELPTFIDRHGRRDTVYWNFVYAPLREADGTIERVTVVATEGTEQVLARQQVQALNATLAATNADLNTSNIRLTRTNVDLDTFIYTASHDLKAPITNIEGLLGTLRDELPAPSLEAAGEVPYILALMQDSVERFKHTIDHLTDVSKMHKEYDQLIEPVPLAPVIEGVRLDLAPLLKQTGGRLDVDVQAVPTVIFSEKSLRSVVFNLLSNALKYRHPDRPPLVQVRARLDEDRAVLEVQDNGLGFEVGREAQLFAMFQRLHTHVEGSGVGLYMVKRLVENTGGRITVTSTLGVGTTFTVYLPR